MMPGCLPSVWRITSNAKAARTSVIIRIITCAFISDTLLLQKITNAGAEGCIVRK